MTTTGVGWDTEPFYDVHVVRGQTSQRLDARLRLYQNDGTAPTAKDLPAASRDVTVRFLPRLNLADTGGLWTGHGVQVNTVTGEVTPTTSGIPDPAVSSFLIEALVTRTAGGAEVGRPVVRVNVHEGATEAWLTPSTLTVHDGSPGQSFSILVLFDEAVVGDVSGHPGITWVSKGAGVTVAANGGLTAVATDGQDVDVDATLPANLGRLVAKGKARPVAGWASQPAATRAADLVKGPGLAEVDNVRNILFVAEGFPDTAADRATFQQVVDEVVREIRTSPSYRPFNLLSDAINYWRVFLPSRESGETTLHELTVTGTGTGTVRTGTSVTVQAEDATAVVGGLAKPTTLKALIREVGLPVPLDAAVPTLAAQRTRWSTLFKVDVSGVGQALYKEWKNILPRHLADERDTALGLAIGQRPAAREVTPDRVVHVHPHRTTRAHLDAFLATVTAGVGGPLIGSIWDGRATPATPDAPAKERGRDADFVVALCFGGHFGGAKSELIAMSLVPEDTALLEPTTATGLRMTVLPNPVVDAAGAVRVPAEIVGTTVHEISHSFDLLDEYGVLSTALPASEVSGLVYRGNLQPRVDLLTTVTNPDGTTAQVLDATGVKWRWPRLKKAGKLVEKPAGTGPYLVQLKLGHAAQFSDGEQVYLRQKLTPFDVTTGTKVVGPLTVVGTPNGDEVEVNDPLGVVNPADFVGGSVLCVPVPASTTSTDGHAELMAQVVRDHMTTSGGPLSAPKATPTRTCAVSDGNVWARIQQPTNRPAAVAARALRYPPWIVGLYEGGANYHCGVYHPTGACIMRIYQVLPLDPVTSQTGNLHPFCHVCQYVLVDKIDARLHGKLDAYFAKIYPQR